MKDNAAKVLWTSFLIIGGLCALFSALQNRLENNVIKKIWLSYETNAEKSAKSETEKKQQKERISASLDKWLNEWAPNESTGFIKLNSLSYKNRFIFGATGEDIWVIKNLPYDKPKGYYSNVYIFHSSDNGSRWEIQWKRPATQDWSGIDPIAIVVINEKRVAVMLNSRGCLGMLYTTDGGESWQVEDKWDPKKIERLRP